MYNGKIVSIPENIFPRDSIAARAVVISKIKCISYIVLSNALDNALAERQDRGSRVSSASQIAVRAETSLCHVFYIKSLYI